MPFQTHTDRQHWFTVGDATAFASRHFIALIDGPADLEIARILSDAVANEFSMQTALDSILNIPIGSIPSFGVAGHGQIVIKGHVSAKVAVDGGAPRLLYTSGRYAISEFDYDPDAQLCLYTDITRGKLDETGVTETTLSKPLTSHPATRHWLNCGVVAASSIDRPGRIAHGAPASATTHVPADIAGSVNLTLAGTYGDPEIRTRGETDEDRIPPDSTESETTLDLKSVPDDGFLNAVQHAPIDEPGLATNGESTSLEAVPTGPQPIHLSAEDTQAILAATPPPAMELGPNADAPEANAFDRILFEGTIHGEVMDAIRLEASKIDLERPGHGRDEGNPWDAPTESSDRASSDPVQSNTQLIKADVPPSPVRPSSFLGPESAAPPVVADRPAPTTPLFDVRQTPAKNALEDKDRGDLIGSVPGFPTHMRQTPDHVPQPTEPQLSDLEMQIPAPPDFEATRKRPSALDGTEESSVANRLIHEADGPVVPGVVCPNGHVNPPESETCHRCGAPILNRVPEDHRRPTLAVLKFADGRRISLTRPCIVGRQPTMPPGRLIEVPELIEVNDPGEQVSRTHLGISLDSWIISVEDLNSTNGSRIARVDGHSLELRDGSREQVNIGDTVFLDTEVWFTLERE